MVRIQPSSTRQNAVRGKAVQTITSLEAILGNKDDVDLMNSFKNRFNICESAYKTVLHEYLHDKSVTHKVQNLKLDMRQIPHALSCFGYNADSDLLRRLFSSRAINGKKTAKMLRNEMTHNVSRAALTELRMRRQELFDDMDSFIEYIKHFDD